MDESTVTIPLTRGYSATIDATDAPLVAGYRWSYQDRPNGPSYAATHMRVNGKWTTISMHRLITNAPRGIEVDHINNDGLDNRRGNLRFATRSQNEQNKSKAKPGSRTGVRGVTYLDGRSKPYRAYLYLNRRHKSLGYYSTLGEAAEAVREGRRRYFTHAPECSEVRP